MAVTVLLKLAALTGDGRYRDAAERGLGLVSAFAARYPTGFAQWLSALDFALAEVLEIAIEDFLALLARSPRMARSVIVSACERLAFAEERIHILAQRGAEDRIVALLLQLARRRGHPSLAQPDFVRLAVTHAELARLAGMNRAHVSVVLNRLRVKDLIRYGRGNPPQVNMPALLKHAEPQSGQIPA